LSQKLLKLLIISMNIASFWVPKSRPAELNFCVYLKSYTFNPELLFKCNKLPT